MVPVVVAGGKRLDSVRDALALASDAVTAGAAGIDFGRNVWQAADPVATIQALRAVVHHGHGVDDALGLYERLADRPVPPAGRAAVADYSIWVLEYACAPDSPPASSSTASGHPRAAVLAHGPAERVAHRAGRHRLRQRRLQPHPGELDGITRWTHPRAVLDRIGVDPGEVDTILLTHAHYDHLGTLEEFPNAVAWLQERELFGWIRALSWPAEMQWLKDGVNAEDLATALDLTRQGRLRLADRRVPDVLGALPGAHLRHPHLRPPARGGRQRARRHLGAAGRRGLHLREPGGVDGDGRYVPIGFATGSQQKCIFAMDQMMRTVGGAAGGSCPATRCCCGSGTAPCTFDDGLHVAEVSLRPGDTSRLE